MEVAYGLSKNDQFILLVQLRELEHVAAVASTSSSNSDEKIAAAARWTLAEQVTHEAVWFW